MNRNVVAQRDLPWGKVAAIAGVLFAVVFFLGTASLNVPQHASDEEVLNWWSDSGNRRTSIVSMYLFLSAALLFLVLLGYLRIRIGSATRDTAMLSSVMVSSGALFSALLAASAVARGLIASAVAYNDEDLPGVDVLRFVPQMSYGLTDAALIAAALAILATSIVVLRTAIFGPWLGWLGLLAAALLVIGTVAFGRPFMIPVVLIWSLATSFAVWRDPDPA